VPGRPVESGRCACVPRRIGVVGRAREAELGRAVSCRWFLKAMARPALDAAARIKFGAGTTFAPLAVPRTCHAERGGARAFPAFIKPGEGAGPTLLWTAPIRRT
jgi:hypothetical protein